MSKNLPEQQNHNSEEVDLGQLFKLIGNAFDRLFNFIGSKFRSVFSVFIFSIKAIVINFKLIALSMIIAGVLGFGLQKIIGKDVFHSQMLVKPFFESKYQLVNNVTYYDELIKDKNYDELSARFGIDKEEAKQLVEIEIKHGPESKNKLLVEYKNFINSIDSVSALEISYKDFEEERDKTESLYDGDIFEIHVKSFSKTIFKSLEAGFNASLQNEHSIKKMKKRDVRLAIEKQRILASLNDIDSLKSVYVDVIVKESNKNNQVLLNDGMAFGQETQDKTKEFELLDKELLLKHDLERIEAEKALNNVYFDTLSSFQAQGSEYFSLLHKYALLFPVLAFLFLTFVYLSKRFILFVESYEG